MKDVTKFKKLELSFNVWGMNHYTVRTKMGVAFISYNSIVAFKAKDSGQVTLGKDWDYSRVTMKNVCQWLGVDGVKSVRDGLERGIYSYDEGLDEPYIAPIRKPRVKKVEPKCEEPRSFDELFKELEELDND